MKVLKLPTTRLNRNNHNNCPQANYQKSKQNNYPFYSDQSSENMNSGRRFNVNKPKQQDKKNYQSYSDVVSKDRSQNSYQGQNIFNHLNC